MLPEAMAGFVWTLFVIGCFVIAIVIGPLILCWAWNLFLVPYFHLPILTFWPAFAAIVLLSIIRKFFK